jgi:hypothetical protein
MRPIKQKIQLSVSMGAAMALAVSVGLVAASAPAQAAPASYTISGMAEYNQARSNTCWAATIRMAAKARKKTVRDECRVTQDVFGNLTCGSASLNKQATIDQVKAGLKASGMSASVVKTQGTLPSQTAMANYISAGKPIIALVTRKVATQPKNHYIIIFGYTGSGATLKYYDPFKSGQETVGKDGVQTMTYQQFRYGASTTNWAGIGALYNIT